MTRKTIRKLVTLAAVCAGALTAVTGASSGGSNFVNFEGAGWPLQPAGVTCPGSSKCMNYAAEPTLPATVWIAVSDSKPTNTTPPIAAATFHLDVKVG